MAKSPFPGMDPYLETHWGDLHSRLIVYMSDQINDQLPADLQARVEESIMVDADEYTRTAYPDVRVIEAEPLAASPHKTVANVMLAEPMIIALPNEIRKQRHLEIIDRNSGMRVVTAIELLSPTNKRSEAGRRMYRAKQNEYLNGGVNLVEIDLVREGDFMAAVPAELIPKEQVTPYIICIRRTQQPAAAEVIPVSLQAPLPNVRIPLRPSDADIVLCLQPLLDMCYDRGRYASLDYSRSLAPYLSREDWEWAKTLLKSKGRKK